MILQLNHRDDAKQFMHRQGDDQGFVDQYGVYMTRQEAYTVAEAAGQLRFPQACLMSAEGGILYSEALY